jgi:hypothetical protein
VVVDGEVLEQEKLFLDRGLDEPEIDGGASPEFCDIELCHAIVETAEPRDLGVDGEPGVFVDPAVVFVEAEGSGEKGPGGQVSADIFIRDGVELGIGFEGGGGFRGG